MSEDLNPKATSERDSNSVTSRPEPPKRPAKTITVTVPQIKLPTDRIQQQLNKVRRIHILAGIALLILALIGGYIGSLIETVGYGGKIYTTSTANSTKLVTSSANLVSSIANAVGPSVVSINDTTSSGISGGLFGFGPAIQQQAAGTGIIISSNGLVLTNRHVVPAGASNISITLENGTTLNDVSVVGRTAANDSLDVAILKINNAQGQTLTPAVIGDSSQVNIGDGVVAIGNALGEFQNTVTSGIISGFGRNISAGSGGNNPFTQGTTENLNDLFQTDAAINEGNSGGPLVNLNGQVIGINTAVASNSQNIGFAIPINDVKGLIEQVIKTGKFQRPFLGVRFVPLTPDIAKQKNLSVNYGAYLIGSGSGSPAVVPGDPAAKAGLRSGDIITKVNGTAINQNNDLTTLIDQYEPGSKVTLTFVRGHTTMNVKVTLSIEPNG